MCDYSIEHVKSRDAKAGDKLTTNRWSTGTTGFAAVDDPELGKFDATAVCLRPGTELVFTWPVSVGPVDRWPWNVIAFRSACKRGRFARFVQQNLGARAHHDALEFPNGETVLLTHLTLGQCATVLQLPVDVLVQKKQPAEPVSYNFVSYSPFFER